MKPQIPTHNFRLFGRAWQGLLPLLALFVSLGSARTVQAQANSSITGSTIIIDRGAGNETFDGQSNTTAPDFDGQNLGTFNVANFSTSLLLNGGTLSTTEVAPDEIRSAILFYEVTNITSGFSYGVKQVPLAAPSNTTGAKTFANSTANANLLAADDLGALLPAGTYSVDVSFRANGRNNNTTRSFTKEDPPGFTYQARFTVQGVRPSEPPTSTTWTGGFNDNWFDGRNWTNGVPNPNRDATIPDFGSGSTVSYPNIYSNAAKPNSTTTTTIQNPDGTFSTVVTQVPGYDNSTSGPAQTRDLIMRGTSQAQRSITRLVVGRLEVYRDFSNLQDSFIQRENTTISFTGTNQSISGSASGLVNVEIDGGGIKSLVANFVVQPGGTLRFINGVLVTNISSVNTSFVELANSAGTGTATVPAARMVGENETTYLRGFVKTAQGVALGVPQDFSNIGVTLTFTGNNNPGVVTITRNTGENYGSINNGANSKPSIRRIFGIRPADQQTNNGGLSATMLFRYLDNETTNLVPNAQTLDENKLALFVSTSSGDVFGQLGRDDLNTGSNTLTKNNITAFATFTLSEATSPLPVTLTAFAAKRIGTNAEITWETVSEQNNRGYEVQVSTDGRTFRTLAFVPSQNANSNRLLRYRYLDTEANKGGIRYYRLRQIDVDGQENFYGPKVLSFSGSATAEARMEAYPNPFQNEVRLTMQSEAAGKGQLQLLDLTGRVVLERSTELTSGTNDLELQNLSGVQSGTYLLRVVTPAGKPQTQRIIKR
ncbi:T9SS type A sorting domain-containing protein [Hymenobacter puniceus]|uniref:T9SS type A sorting domain-containing protein n=1 Tax=Hymenobacter sp. BT190 TaxID=2763505 RepID=UPI0016518AAA|nr:T9SS type A sorting domain-containing protein [Hymenobacter sp. BT190]MBC6697449.1 T9SS type A sorting domain-containing protein [Hymenobacter sp. BT190]